MNTKELELRLKCYIVTNFIPASFLKGIYGWNTRPYPKSLYIAGVEYVLKNENCYNEHYEREK
jgi:hypothetical protein